MRQFTVTSKRGEVSVVEVEIEKLSGVAEPGLKEGEWKARILRPESFHMKIEKSVDGKKETVLTPDVWCWHAFHETQEEATAYAHQLIKQEFAFNERKYGTAFTEEDVATACAAVKLVPLTA